MRKAIIDYNMIEDGDRIAVGVSGGKDSLATLAGLAGLRRFLGKDFSVVAITLDPQFGGVPNDFSAVAEFCKKRNIEFVLKQTNIGTIIFEDRREANPCSLCARMRRGLLHDLAKEHGCNKMALGHNFEDAVETFMMNLFDEGSKSVLIEEVDEILALSSLCTISGNQNVCLWHDITQHLAHFRKVAPIPIIRAGVLVQIVSTSR